jgi:hypothetical protein
MKAINTTKSGFNENKTKFISKCNENQSPDESCRVNYESVMRHGHCPKYRVPQNPVKLKHYLVLTGMFRFRLASQIFRTVSQPCEL